MNIYYSKNNHPNLSTLLYMVPIDVFALQTCRDVTHLHLAEHCCFGAPEYSEKIYQSAYRFGGHSLLAWTTKSGLEFSLTFFDSFARNAIDWLCGFVAACSKASTKKEVNIYRKELTAEMKELPEIYDTFTSIRENVFTQAPYKLCSGGSLIDITSPDIDQINSYKKIIAERGQFILSASINFDLTKIGNYSVKSLTELPTRNIEKPPIKKELFSTNNTCALVLNGTNAYSATWTRAYFDYIVNELDLFEHIEISLAAYPDTLVVSFLSTDLKQNVAKILTALNSSEVAARAKIYAANIMIERELYPEEMARDAAADWINCSASCKNNPQELIAQITSRLTMSCTDELRG